MTKVIGLRSFSEAPAEGIVSIHHPLTPAEVYVGQPISASVRFDSGSLDVFSVPVYRLSPLGVELDATSLGTMPFRLGSVVDLRIEISKQICDFSGVMVATEHEEDGRRLLGIRWCQAESADNAEEEKREHSRWYCGDHFLPTGVAPNPAKFNDFVYFSVRDISKQGMQLSTSLRNKFLIPGMTLEATVSFPMIGQLVLHLKVNNARIRSEGGKEFLALGTQFLDQDPEIMETIGQYLLQFGPKLTVAELRKAGFSVRSTQSVVDFSFVKTADDYREALMLRQVAYSKAGKADLSSDPQAMSDIYDAKSRILLARHNGIAVGSLRLTFHTPDEPNEYDQFVTFPKDFPRRDEIIVVSRICTHAEYRGSDLFYGLMRQCVLAVLQSKRRYILGGCTEALLPLYKKLGFKTQNIFYEHGSLKGAKEQIVVADVMGMLSGADTGLAVWNELYSDLTSYIEGMHDTTFDPAMNARLAVYRLISPVSRLFTRGVKNPKKRA